MNTRVLAVLGDSAIRIQNGWEFHGVRGDVVHVVGLNPSLRKDLPTATEELRTLLQGKVVNIAERWYVKGHQLVAVVTLEGKEVADYLPARKARTLEPSRKFDPGDTAPLVNVSGGLPRMWDNPIIDLPPNKAPFFNEVFYPTKWWEPAYDRQRRIVDRLYVDHTNLNPRNLQKIATFTETPGQSAMIISGECGSGKTWFTIKQFIDGRPADSDFAYIDLRGRPTGAELKEGIHRELGAFLDEFINQKLDVLTALRFYLEPIVKPLFPQKEYDVSRLPVQEAMREAYKALAYPLPNIVRYNEIRLGYYDHAGKTIYLIIDNVDNYDQDEQLVVYQEIIRCFHGHSGVKLIVPLRPSSRLMTERLREGLDFMPIFLEMKSPDVAELLAHRVTISINGTKIDPKTEIDNAGINWSTLIKRYINSDSALLIRDLCSYDSGLSEVGEDERANLKKTVYDCRHYVRLFRRLLFSDVLMDLSNICSEYFAIHALLLRPSEPFTSESSFLYNLFDNEDPELIGNALIRYRVLEYFHNNQDYAGLFDMYFRALGSGPRVARKLTEAFVNAGLLFPMVEIDRGKEIWTGVRVTYAGRRHLALTRNLWYGICVKTGMHVERQMVKLGEEARTLASKYVTASKVLDFYAEHGWVSDEDFIRFLWKQEALEAHRIGHYQSQNPGELSALKGLLEHLTSPGDILSQDYAFQIDRWEKKKEKHNAVE